LTAFTNGEFAAISALKARLPVPPADVAIWIGDDTAAIALPDGCGFLLLTVDTVVAGVHADLGRTGVDDFGWKAVAAAVSDIAAMGGDAGHALVSVAAPDPAALGPLYDGIAAAASEFGCPVVGGDLTSSSQLVVTVTVTGYCRSGRPVARSGARPGDAIWVTGPLGGSAAGLRILSEVARSSDPEPPVPGGRAPGGVSAGGRAPGEGVAGSDAVRAHARPVPQLAAGRAARRAGATAMIDVSDGLSADLDHLAAASGVGVRLDSVPVHPEATMEEAMSGGEDYQLVFCAPESADIDGTFGSLFTPIRVGHCTSDPNERTVAGRPFTPTGWGHFS
jgi:thiamine-monophosphate kinase